MMILDRIIENKERSVLDRFGSENLEYNIASELVQKAKHQLFKNIFKI